MTVTGPFQSLVVKKVIFCLLLQIIFYVVCQFLHLSATNNKSNLNIRRCIRTYVLYCATLLKFLSPADPKNTGQRLLTQNFASEFLGRGKILGRQ